MDESSAELLEHLLPLVARAPVLVVVIMRPEREGPAARIRHIAATQHADRHVGIDLAGLAAEDCTRLVGNLLGAGDVPVSVRSLVLGRTGGNPFFVEEVVNALVDMRALVRDETTGAWTATSALAEVSIPDTVQGVIAARVDRLDEELRAVLKLASVIGRTFLYRVLRAITDDAGLDRHLGQLEDVALIRERRRIPELEYAFRHALVQEATYESLLVDRRRQLHREVARVLEGLFADRLDEVYGVLAYHASRAEDWGRARDYLLKAGDHASRIAADAEALLHYGRAIESYAAARGDRWDPVERAVLERKVGEALFRRGDHDQALGYLGRALARLGTPAPTSRWGTRRAIARETLRQIVRRLRRPRIGPAASTALPPAVIERCRIYEVRSWIDYFVDQERLVLDALLLLNVAERHGLPVGTAEGSTGVGSICDAIPLPRVAGHYHQRAVAIAEASREPQAIGMAYLGLGYHEHLCLGEWTKAVEHFRHAAGVFRDMGELRGWGGATTLATVVEIRQGALLAVLARSDELIRIGADAGDRQVLGWGRLVRGWTLGYAGRFAEAIESLQEAAMLFRAIPADGAVVEALGLLAQCELGERRLDDARATLAASEELIARRRLRGHQTTSTLVASAALWLAMAEAQAAPSRAEALRQAARSIGSLRRHARAVTGARSGAERMRGTLEWLGGDAGRAAEAWRRSLAVAESLGARYDVALTRLERGTRLGDREDVGRAESILIEIGAAAILERARAAGRTSTRTRDAG